MTALARKLLRDLSRMKGQAITIALVVACGIASYVTLRTAYASLVAARDDYYASQRFGDVFVHLKRAPDSVVPRIEAIPGVAVADARLVEAVMLPMDDLAEPATGRLVGIPMDREPRLDAPWVVRGRMPEPRREDEVAVIETFARAHRLEPGSRLPVVLNGTRKDLRVVGIVMSPEYVVALAAGMVADDRRFGVLWMDRAVVGPAFQDDGAFDDVVLRLQPAASGREVVDRLDRLLAPYGGLGAYLRERHPSEFVVSNELTGLESYATIGPFICLSVAAFLVNVVLARLVHLQRPQIATLKALGYTKNEIGLHYLELVLVIVVTGAALGVALGAFLGRGMLSLYERYFHFPVFAYRLDGRVVAVSVVMSIVTGSLGALGTVRRVARLPPAEAMQPEAPPTYRASILERLGLGRLLGGAARMVLRELTRRPVKTLLSVLGVAMGISVIVSGSFVGGAMDAAVLLEFETAQREDVAVTFTDPVDGSAVRELRHAPGVLYAEGLRVVPVRVRHGHVAREVTLTGHPEGAELRRILEWPRHIVAIPKDGVLLTDMLATRLGVAPGDVIEIDVLEGRRETKRVVVSAVAHEMFGLNAHMAMPALQALLGETDVVSVALLNVDPRLEGAVDAALKTMPKVAAVSRRKDTIAEFERQTAESMHTTSLVLTLFGAVIAFGVVYNDARVALSTRARDLASLRVLGFFRREISAVLLGELATYVVLAIAPGLALGRLLAGWIMSVNDPEMFRMPGYVSSRTYVFAAAVTVLAALASALVVRKKIDRLDLVSVLKARE